MKKRIILKAPRYGYYDFSWLPKEIYPGDKEPDPGISFYNDTILGMFHWCSYTMEEINVISDYREQLSKRIFEIKERTKKQHRLRWYCRWIISRIKK